MVLKPNNWDTPKRCRHINASYCSNTIKNLPCMRDECPISMWIPPVKKIGESIHGKFLYEKGKCKLDGDQNNF